MANVTATFPTTPDGMDDPECQCGRCGSSCHFQECWSCGGEGEHDERDDFEWPCIRTCTACLGKGGWWTCASGTEWCAAHPMPGREAVNGGTVEWFDLAVICPRLSIR